MLPAQRFLVTTLLLCNLLWFWTIYVLITLAEWGKWDKFLLMCTLALALISGLCVPGRIHIPPLQVWIPRVWDLLHSSQYSINPY